MNKTGYVFQEDDAGSHLANDTGDVVPDPALVVGLLPTSGDAPGLAGKSRSDEIHDATPRSAVEGDNVIPDRRRIQGLFFHPRHERGRGVGFPFDVDGTLIVVPEGQSKPELKSTDPGADGHASDSLGM